MYEFRNPNILCSYMSPSLKEIQLNRQPDLELALTLISKNRVPTPGTKSHMDSGFSPVVFGQLVTDLFENKKGYLPIDRGVMNNPVGFIHILNLKATLYAISNHPEIPENVKGALQNSVELYNPEIAFRDRDDIGLLATVVDVDEQPKVFTPDSFHTSPKNIVPTLMGTAWDYVSMSDRFDYWTGGEKQLTQDFFDSHNVVYTRLPLEVRFNPEVLTTIKKHDNLLGLLRDVQQNKKQRDFKPEHFGLTTTQKELELACFLIMRAYNKAAGEAIIQGRVTAEELLIRYHREIINNTLVHLEELTAQDAGCELVTFVAYSLGKS